MPTASSLPERLLSPKSQDAVALQQIKERGALPMIDRGDIRQQSTAGKIPGLPLPGAGYVLPEHKADSLIAKFKEAGGTVREIDVWAESPRLSPLPLFRLNWLVAAVNHYRDNAITYKPSDKNARELKLANAAITDMQMRQRDVAALDAKYREGVSWMLKRKWCSAWWCCRWSSSVAHQQSVSQCVKPPPPPAWIMRSSTYRHRWTGLFHSSERGWSLCKNNWKEPRSILMSSADK